MYHLTEHDVFLFVTQLGVIIFCARLLGEIFRRFGQPVIAGEVFAGILLGPTFFGKFFPEARDMLFPVAAPQEYLLQGISWLCVLLLLLITGLEIDLQAYVRHGRQSFSASAFGVLLPFVGIYFVTGFLPEWLFPADVPPALVRLMLATCLSLVSIPVIAKILFDFKILRSYVGINIISSGVLSDVWGWAILGVIVSVITTGVFSLVGIVKPVVSMVLYLLVTLTAGRWIVDRIVTWIDLQTDDVTNLLAFLFSFTLLNSAIAHFLGLHIVFGAFVAGIMVGESEKINPHMRQTIQDIILGVLAPIFFALIGMQLNLLENQNWTLIVTFFILASVWKIGGAFLGGVMGGIGRKNALTLACGLMTQGTMGIIAALIGKDLGIFTESLFSAIVIVSILTAVLVGPLLKWAIRRVRRPLAEFFTHKHIFLNVSGNTKKEVIENMVDLMSVRGLIKHPGQMRKVIWQREELMTTAIGEGIAMPHARINDFKEPMMCFFRLKNPIDFDSTDDVPVQLLFLELTDSNDDGIQLMLLSQVVKFLSTGTNRQRLLEATNEEQIHHILSFDETA